MKHLAPHDRPREKLIRLGPSALGDNELVAILIGEGAVRRAALDVANDALHGAGGLHGLTRLTVPELAMSPGVGPVKAARLLAAIELGRRTLTLEPSPRVPFGSPREAAAYLIPRYGARSVEQFGIVLLDTKHRVLRTSLLSVGTLDASLVHPREVFREASVGGAAAILLFHNHPSGDPTPSHDDVIMTARLVEAGHLMGIEILDHLVLADARYCSFKETGRL